MKLLFYSLLVLASIILVPTGLGWITAKLIGMSLSVPYWPIGAGVLLVLTISVLGALAIQYMVQDNS